MKRILLILFAALLAVSCGERIIMAYGDMEINGKVKYLEQSSYTVSEQNGEIVKDSLSSKLILRFDSEGKIIEDNWCDYSWDIYLKNIFKYDFRGNKIEDIRFHSSNDILYRTIYDYDTMGSKISKKVYDSDNRLSSYESYKYDSLGNLIENTSQRQDLGIKEKLTGTSNNYSFDIN